MTGDQYGPADAKLLKTAFILSIITIVYNVGEGLFSTLFGYSDDTLALFGFGVDSFVEVISGIGIGHMVWRMRRNPVSERDRFERRALSITGGSFFLLAAGLVIGSVLAIASGARPLALAAYTAAAFTFPAGEQAMYSLLFTGLKPRLYGADPIPSHGWIVCPSITP